MFSFSPIQQQKPGKIKRSTTEEQRRTKSVADGSKSSHSKKYAWIHKIDNDSGWLGDGKSSINFCILPIRYLSTANAWFPSDDILIIIMLWSYGFNGTTMCKICTNFPCRYNHRTRLTVNLLWLLCQSEPMQSVKCVWIRKRPFSHSARCQFHLSSSCFRQNHRKYIHT